MNYLLDTAALIYLLEDRPQAKKLLKLLESGDRFGVSFMTAAEFLVGAPASARRKFMELLESRELPFYELSGPGDDLSLAETRKKSNLKMPDAMILETAIRHGLTLVTADELLAKKAKSLTKVVLLEVRARQEITLSHRGRARRCPARRATEAYSKRYAARSATPPGAAVAGRM